MKSTPTIVRDAIDKLLRQFETGDYNPTPLIDLGALVANADGKVEPEELEGLRGILEPMLGADLDDELVGFLVDASAKNIAEYGVGPRMRVTAQILEDCDAVEIGITVALAIAFARQRARRPRTHRHRAARDRVRPPQASPRRLDRKGPRGLRSEVIRDFPRDEFRGTDCRKALRARLTRARGLSCDTEVAPREDRITKMR